MKNLKERKIPEISFQIFLFHQMENSSIFKIKFSTFNENSLKMIIHDPRQTSIFIHLVIKNGLLKGDDLVMTENPENFLIN